MAGSSQSSARAERAELEPLARAGRVGDGVEIAAVSRRGRRHHANEDQYLVAELERSVFVRLSGLPTGAHLVGSPRATEGREARQGHVLMVADGVGGREGGRLASSTVVEHMASHVLTTIPWIDAHQGEGDALERSIEACVRDAQRHMREEARRRDIDPTLGTTLTMAYVSGPSALVAHVGDSRAYRSRGGELERITRDHTIAQALLDAAGDLDRRLVEARWGHVLENVIGGSSDDLEVDMRVLDLVPGDRLMLCTDGLTAYLDDEELRRRLASLQSVETLVDQLTESAFERGGHDDITVLLAQF